MRVLAIETSCDETAAAVLEQKDGNIQVLSSVVSSQVDLHAAFGGVVPNLAAREHARNIAPVVGQALKQADIGPAELDFLAVTQGPGLIPALLVGVTAAKTLAATWHKPLLGIQHIEGHIYANLIGENQKTIINNQNFSFPLLALVVSGGHTELVLMRNHFQYEILGETQDDASGEAFDKVAKMLGLPYPGGPIVAKRADDYRRSKFQDTNSKIQTNFNPQLSHSKPLFPRPMLESDDYDFSFSGLKTAVLYHLKKQASRMEEEAFIDEICHEFQEAVVDVLVAKTRKALEEFAPKTFVIAGGVSANVRLRERLEDLLNANFPECRFLTPPFRYSLDNAAMIGAAALLRYDHMSNQQREVLSSNRLLLEPSATLPLQNL